MGPRVRAGAYLFGTLAVAAIGTCALVAWFTLGPTVDGALRRRDFDAERWRVLERLDDDGLWVPRMCRVDDLLESGVVDALTEDGVLRLLGPPADESFPFGARHCGLHDRLGPDPLGLDSEWLFTDFDAGGVVERLWIYVDGWRCCRRPRGACAASDARR